MNFLSSYKIHFYTACRQLRKLFLLSFLIGAFSCQNGGAGDIPRNNELNSSGRALLEGAVIEFDATICDFGRVYEGETVGWYFKYTNAGNKNLVLVNVSASCGCTTPEYTKEPLGPGEQGQIKVVFDTNGRTGKQYKTIQVETNGQPSTTQLEIKAEVIRK